jgi:hypothetical protein
LDCTWKQAEQSLRKDARPMVGSVPSLDLAVHGVRFTIFGL